jgi:hypothetical protein
MNWLGQAGLACYLTDADVVSSNKEVAKTVFYAIHSSLQGGNACSLVMALYDAKTLGPFRLWSDIVAYYDTEINRANIILFEMKRLLNLRLDPDVTPTSFIANFKECLLCLQKHNAKLVEDTDTLHALLLVAIQDDQFEMIRDNIIHKPTLSIDEILKDIHEHDTSIQMKDGACNITDDGTSLSGWQTATREPHQKCVSCGECWNIPFFPESWSQVVRGKKLRLMINWCMMAMKKGSTQNELNKAFALKTEIFHPKSSGSNSQKSQHSRQQHGNDNVKMTEDVDNNDDPDEGDSKPPPCKRIHLASSQWVITECNCHRVHRVLAYLSCADPGQPILISDSACDQSLITRDWTVLKWTGCHVLMTVAFAGRNVSEKFPVLISAAKLRDENGNVYVAIANEALYDDDKAQVKSLLSVHQALANPKNGIHDHARCEHDVDCKHG